MPGGGVGSRHECSYELFGLRIGTNRPLPWFADVGAGDDAMDVHVHFTAGRTEIGGDANPAAALYAGPETWQNGRPVMRVLQRPTDGSLVFEFGEGVVFVVEEGGTRITCSAEPSLALEDVATYLVGHVLACALTFRRVFCLHASAVAAGNAAVAFVGSAGAGKSTTAAALATAGFSTVTDDVLALQDAEEGFVAIPSYPHLRLWPDSAARLFGSEGALPRLSPDHPTWDKRYFDASHAGAFAASPQPLKAVYILGERDGVRPAPGISSLSRAKALVALIPHTYGNCWFNVAMQGAALAFLNGLVRRVPVRSLVLPASADRLPELGRAVLRDLELLEGEGAAA